MAVKNHLHSSSGVREVVSGTGIVFHDHDEQEYTRCGWRRTKRYVGMTMIAGKG